MLSGAALVLDSSILAYAAGGYCLVCLILGPKKSLALGQGMFFLGACDTIYGPYEFGFASTIIFFCKFLIIIT